MSDLYNYYTTKARYSTVAALGILPLFDVPFRYLILCLGLLVGGTTLLDLDTLTRGRLAVIYMCVAAAAWVLFAMNLGFFWTLLGSGCCIGIAIAFLSGIPKSP